MMQSSSYLPTGTGHIARALRYLDRQMRRGAPSRSPGVLVEETPDGVRIRPKPVATKQQVQTTITDGAVWL